MQNNHRTRLFKRPFPGLFTVFLLLAAGVRPAAAQPPGGGMAPPPPPEVAFITIQTEKVTLTTELPGRTSPYLVAEVRPQVSGIILKRSFTEGSNVTEGDILYEIEPAPYQAAYDLAVAGLARAEASIPPLELMVKRQKDLVPTGAVSQQGYDEVVAKLQQARAEVEYSKAAIQSAKINLDFTKVKAPISGRIGRSNVTVGALATAHQGPPFATIQPTSQMQRLERGINRGLLSRDETSVKQVGLLLDDGSRYGQEGTLQFRDVTVDPTTGSVVLRILFPNPDAALLPGMFVRAVVTEGVNEQAILVPQQAVSRTGKGQPLVMTVNGEGKTEQKMLTLERALGDKWLVSEGLAVGDRVIVEGLQRLRPGMAVNAVPWEAAPAASAAPAPAGPAAEPEPEKN